jgi:hypothetical protein
MNEIDPEFEDLREVRHPFSEEHAHDPKRRVDDDRHRAVGTRIHQLRTDVAEGLEQAQRGELIPGEEVFARRRRKSREHSP